jgi:hypothetical protein
MVDATCCGCAQYKKIADLLRIPAFWQFFRYETVSATYRVFKSGVKP